jgi:spermidine synthase
MIGFGGGQMSNYLFHHLPGVEIDGVDLDPEVVRLARKWFEVPESPRYRTHAGDGRVFLERGEPGRRWDMIVLDAFRGVFVPYHLKTREFYAACLARLTPGGVVVANLHDGSSMHRHDRATFAAVFPTLYGFTSESRLQTSLVASATTQWLSAWHLRANARAVQPAFDFDLEGLAARLVLDPSVPKGGRVLSDDFDPRELGEAAARHNESCREDCAYPTR